MRCFERAIFRESTLRGAEAARKHPSRLHSHIDFAVCKNRISA